MDLLFIPGLISHLDLDWEDSAYRSFIRCLGRMARVIRYDKLGNGLSDPVAELPTMQQRCQEALAVLAAAESTAVVIFGHCEGGPIALRLAAERPDLVRGLLLYGTGARATPQVAIDRFRRTVDSWGSGATLDLFACSLAGDPLARAARGRLERAAASPALAMATFDALGRADAQHLLPQIHVPTIVIHRRDEIVPVSEGRLLAEGIDGARFVEISGQDHLPWIGDTAPLLDAIADLLRRDQPRAAGSQRSAGASRRAARPAAGARALTPRELQVARLAARGLSNPEIARQLFVSRHTVETHLKNVSAKLGIDGRAKLAALVGEEIDP